jgi:Kef-type K+ transport system membrane component KefB
MPWPFPLASARGIPCDARAVMNPTAIEHHLKWVLLQWGVIIVVAWTFGRLGRRAGQPLAVGEILGGIVLGPSILGQFWPEGMAWLFPMETKESLQLLAKIGLILLLFQVGLEFDFGHLRTRSRTVVSVSAFGIAMPFICGLLAGPWLRREFAPEVPALGFQLFVCIALSISALPIMGRILIEMGLERTALGAMAVSSAAIDDVIGWILLAVGTALVQSGFHAAALLWQVGGILIFFVGLQKLVGPWLMGLWRRQNSGQANPELSSSFLALLLVGLFACCLITHQLGIFTLFGAFMFGVSLHREVTLVRAWRARFSQFVLVALVPIFFTNTGLRTEVGALTTWTAWIGCGVVLVAAVAGKLGGCYLGARLTGQSNREAVSIAALMNTRALMGLVAINISLELGLLTRELFTMFVIMALLTTVMTGPMLRLWLPPELRELTQRARRID